MSHDVITGNRSLWGLTVGVGVGLAVCGLVALGNLFKAGTTCGETSGCAREAAKNGIYQGVLTAPEADNAPLRNVNAPLYIESLDRDIGRLRTDSGGRYCIVWANESVYPVVRFPTRSERLRTDWRPLDGAEPPAGCQTFEAEIPWDRASGVPEQAEPRLVYILAGLGALVLLAGAVARKLPVALAGLLLAGASAVAWVVVWG